ncbi:MAG TPA: putative Ig domain-containing protein, partial [Bryobacteraceae bacterium]|nr:putative Ig domain-containing protein [Bryobacteraceae bacterium]
MKRLAGILLLGTAALLARNPDNYCEITTNALLTQAVKNVPASYTISTANCGPIRFYRLVTGTLPPGLSLSPVPGPTLTISGTPVTPGIYAFSIRAFDSNYNIPSKSFVIKVNDELKIDTPALATATASQSYTDTVRASGGVGPYTFSLATGTLPTGLTLASNGGITGTMSATGSYFRVRV